MCIDVTNATITVDVVAGKQQIYEFECELAWGVSRCIPDIKFQPADLQNVPFIDRLINGDGR